MARRDALPLSAHSFPFTDAPSDARTSRSASRLELVQRAGQQPLLELRCLRALPSLPMTRYRPSRSERETTPAPFKLRDERKHQEPARERSPERSTPDAPARTERRPTRSG